MDYSRFRYLYRISKDIDPVAAFRLWWEYSVEHMAMNPRLGMEAAVVEYKNCPLVGMLNER